jgi:hypothetical protein
VSNFARGGVEEEHTLVWAAHQVERWARRLANEQGEERRLVTWCWPTSATPLNTSMKPSSKAVTPCLETRAGPEGTAE